MIKVLFVDLESVQKKVNILLKSIDQFPKMLEKQNEYISLIEELVYYYGSILKLLPVIQNK